MHIGDNPSASYDDGSVIQHVGAHNMIRTLNWMYKNFPNPSHVFLTGCSAGGTAIPIAYDLINKHYNTLLKGGRSVNINSIMDSSVYLTPSYFLQNGFPNWHPESIMKKKLKFNYDRYKYDESYPDLVWNHVLKRGSNKDKWGFVTHSTDPISLMFYQYMSGNGDGGDDNGRSLQLAGQEDRRLDDDLQSQWWTEISNSMNYVKKKHRNVDTYVIDSEGHCSFGLYYPLQEEGFEAWATSIVKEKMIIGNRLPSILTFALSLALGGLLIFFSRRMKRNNGKKGLIEDENIDSSYVGESNQTSAKRVGKVETAIRDRPWTVSYILTTTIYFISMLISQGFAHPLDNPAFGSSAVGLSQFGINNPSLVIYKMQYFRIVTASFLCSGITTYLLMAYTLIKTGLETTMASNNHPHWHFPIVAVILSLAINLFYACIGNGASCASLAIALGLNTFSATMRRRFDAYYHNTWRFTTIVFILGCSPLFPFDSLVALTTAVLTGIILGFVMFVEEDAYHNDDHMTANREETSTKKRTFVLNLGFLDVATPALMLFLLLVFRIPKPDVHNVYPYLTGCGLVYSDQVGDFVNAYAGGAGGGGRLLEEGNEGDMFNGDNVCAQLCLPHLIYRPAVWGAQQFASSVLNIERGTCEENEYNSHIADKTIEAYSVVFEVQLYTSSYDGDNGDEN